MSDRKSVSSHLQIRLEEYDFRIRTFVPYYEEMLGELERLVEVLAPEAPRVLDLGIGTGAFSDRCLRVRPDASIVGIDTDSEMLGVVASRLQPEGGLELWQGSYLDVELPEVDLIGGSISLHHVPEPEAKKDLYVRCRGALQSGGSLLVADCFPSGNESLAAEGFAAWRRHLEQHYTSEETTEYFRAWSGEDTHFSLPDELDWLGQAGFQTDVIWRKDLWAVLLCW